MPLAYGIKNIELLSRIIKSNGASKVKAETFRQAKFNGREAVSFLFCKRMNLKI